MGVPELPLVVLPHPVGDLAEEKLMEMAHMAYPKIVTALTKQEKDTFDYDVDYVLPNGIKKKCEICAE